MAVSYSKFKKILRSFGTLILYTCCLVAFIMGGVVAYRVFIYSPVDETPTATVEPNHNSAKRVRYSFTAPIKLPGTDFAFIALVDNLSKAPQTYYATGTTSNILFTNLATSQSHWLLPGIHQRINQWEILYKKKSYQSDSLSEGTFAIIYEIVSFTANAEDGEKNIYISDAFGKDLKKLIPDIEHVSYLAQLSDTNFLILYQKNGQQFAATYNLPDMTLLGNQALPKLDGMD